MMSLIKRVWTLLVTLFFIVTATFFLMKAIPGDPFTDEKALPEKIHKALREHYGLDDPLHEQYVRYLKSVVTFDLGPSFKYKNRTVNEIILDGFPVSAILGAEALLIAITLGISAGAISALYYGLDLANANEPPNGTHWFGTDDLGRDVFTRAWYGARISLFVGIAAAIIDLMIGVLWGGIAAFSGKRIDSIMMRTADILYALPYLLVVILLLVIIGPGLLSIVVAMTVIGWITMARIVRGQILQLKEQEYILASRALGAGFWRLLFRHLIPNATGPILATLTLTIPSAIFTEAFLSFLGLGVQAPIASWGTMANEGLPALAYYPWRLFVPATLISITLFAFQLLGEGFRDSLQRKGVDYVPAS